MSGTWKIINSLLNKHKPATFNIRLVAEQRNTCITDPKQVVDALNSYFGNIGPHLASQINQDNNNDSSKTLPKSVSNSMVLMPTDCIRNQIVN